jgi:O-antigen/teichoic acid export membrane protein
MSSKKALTQARQKNLLARNTGWMFLGQGLRLAVQALYFTVIARGLGVTNYGSFVGVVALVGILTPFGTLGSGFLLVKNVSRDPDLFPQYWGRGLLTTATATSILFGLVLLVARCALPAAIPMKLVMLVAAADLFGMSITTLCSHAFQAFERLHWTAAINVAVSTSRMLAAVTLVALYRHPSALQWGTFYFGATAFVSALALALVISKLGRPTYHFRSTAAETREGFYFSTSLSAQTIYNDIDKAMLARLGTLDATGIYGAAYRLIDVSFSPVSSLLAAAYPNFFRAGTGGIAATLRYAKPLLLRALAYALLVCLGWLAAAGIVPYVLGGDYRFAEEALRWLAVLPLLRVVHFLLSDALTGAGYTGLRSSIQVGVALFNVLINFWLIPAYSWRGAAWSSIASDALLACAIGMAVFVLSRSQRLSSASNTVEVQVEA